MKLLWFALGWMSVALGVVGIVLPGLPTVPFLLLAAFAFSRSSERAHRWLVDHARLGPPIRDWQATGSIRRRIKWISTAMMAAAFLVALLAGAPWWALALQVTALTGAGIFVWTRPEPASPDA
ncbi:MAG: YbaN family protein [Pseudomonadota bacterium]|nr:YbaN family protein [Pseudomonadota bacterium]MEE3100403.1 YbaN family protein [Pseudomonadota bacterium]